MNHQNIKVGDTVRVVKAPEGFKEEWSREGVVIHDSPGRGGVRVRHEKAWGEDGKIQQIFAWSYDEVILLKRQYELPWGGFPLGGPG